MTQTTTIADSPLLRRLDQDLHRYEELQTLLNDPAILSKPQQVIAISREAGQLQGIVAKYREYQRARDAAQGLRDLIENKADAEMAELAAAELPEAQAKVEAMLEGLKDEFIAAEDNAVDSFFLEIRAGTGGEEAALFGRDLFEMYRRYCEKHGWRFDVSDFSNAERGGLKEVIINVRGTGAYRHLQHEAGGHRVQRVPETEAQGRIHTSAATVAVLPELPDVQINIDPKDVEEQGCRGGGPGGQNVNKVETGWRIIHKPTGLNFKMTEHKSQAQNKERAWALLRATLYEAEHAKQHAAVTSARRTMMGSGNRNERIRTYNFPPEPLHRPPPGWEKAAAKRTSTSNKSSPAKSTRSSPRCWSWISSRGWSRYEPLPASRDLAIAVPHSHAGLCGGADVMDFFFYYPSGRGYTYSELVGHCVLTLGGFAFGIFFAATAVLYGAKAIQWRRRLANGLCPVCGYDLRATPERCPECGTPAGAAKGVASPSLVRTIGSDDQNQMHSSSELPCPPSKSKS